MYAYKHTRVNKPSEVYRKAKANSPRTVLFPPPVYALINKRSEVANMHVCKFTFVIAERVSVSQLLRAYVRVVTLKNVN